MRVWKKAALAAAITVPMMAGGAYAKQTTIHFWVAWTPGASDAVAATKAIKSFETANPDIHVDTQVIAYDAMHDKLVTAIAGGDAPDISWGLIEWFGELTGWGHWPTCRRSRQTGAGRRRSIRT